MIRVLICDCIFIFNAGGTEPPEAFLTNLYNLKVLFYLKGYLLIIDCPFLIEYTNII
jgi:hypothetical protein